MNMKPIVAVAIALTVGIVTFSGVLIPAIESGVDTHDTFTNTGLYKMEKITDSDEYTLKWEYATPNQITRDGEVIALSQGGYPLTILFTEDIMVRVSWGASCEVFGATDTLGANTVIGAAVNSSTDLTITASSDTITITNGTDTKTYDMSAGMIVSSDGPYVMKNYNTDVYMNGDSEFYVAGYTYRALEVQYTNFVGIFEGTIDDGVDPISYVPSTYTLSDPTMVYTNGPSGYKNFYKFTGFTMGITDGENSGTLTYTQIIVPSEISAEKSIHADASTILLFQTIPVFIVLGMIVAVVGVLYMKTRR